MSWESFNLKDASPSEPQLPESKGTLFIFQGAKLYKSPEGVEKLLLNCAVAEDNEFKGQRATVSIPDPEGDPMWARVAARFREALGVNIENGEGPVVAFNKQRNVTFIAPVVKKKAYVDREGNQHTDETQLNVFAVRAAD